MVLRGEFQQLSGSQLYGKLDFFNVYIEKKEIVILWERFIELEWKLIFEQQCFDLWERLYVEVKD